MQEQGRASWREKNAEGTPEHLPEFMTRPEMVVGRISQDQARVGRRGKNDTALEKKHQQFLKAKAESEGTGQKAEKGQKSREPVTKNHSPH